MASFLTFTMMYSTFFIYLYCMLYDHLCALRPGRFLAYKREIAEVYAPLSPSSCFGPYHSTLVLSDTQFELSVRAITRWGSKWREDKNWDTLLLIMKTRWHAPSPSSWSHRYDVHRYCYDRFAAFHNVICLMITLWELLIPTCSLAKSILKRCIFRNKMLLSL